MSKSLTLFKCITKAASYLALVVAAGTVQADWKLDLSRRQEDLRKLDLQTAQPTSQPSDELFTDWIEPATRQHDIVILHTAQGFVPNTVPVEVGRSYRLHVVNVNSEAKNVSFILEAFSEFQATYFGEVRSFSISPQKPGIYKFQSPETARQGRLVVQPPAATNDATRKLAGESVNHRLVSE